MTFKAKVDTLAQMLYKTETSPEEYRQINGKDNPARCAWCLKPWLYTKDDLE